MQDFFENVIRTEQNLNSPNIELETIQPPTFQPDAIDNFESQALAYVVGFVMKKIDSQILIECEACKPSLLIDSIESEHISLKEYDTVRRLKYVTKDFVIFMAHVYELIYFYLRLFGHPDYITFKLKKILKEKVCRGLCKSYLESVFTLKYIRTCDSKKILWWCTNKFYCDTWK